MLRMYPAIKEIDMTIAPNPLFTERTVTSFDRSMAPAIPGNRGDLRHEAGIASDTDVPSDFVRGAYMDTAALPGTINRVNPESYHKSAAETMKERAHLGSAAWEQAPQVLSDFVDGAGVGQAPPSFERIMNNGGPQWRRAISVITD